GDPDGKKSGRGAGPHGEVHFPVLSPDRRRVLAGVVEERIARRVRLPFQEAALVDAVGRGLDDAGILPRLDLLLQPITLWATSDVDECGQPVEGGEHLVLDGGGPDHTG